MAPEKSFNDKLNFEGIIIRFASKNNEFIANEQLDKFSYLSAEILWSASSQRFFQNFQFENLNTKLTF